MTNIMVERFSYSSLETYKKCPSQFRFRYIDKVVKPDEGIEAFMGKRVHEALEHLYDEILKGRLTFIDEIIEKYHQVWEANWHDRIAIVRKENTVKYYYELGERCIALFYRTYSPFDQPVVGTEVEFVFSIDGTKDYMMKGIADRVDYYGKGKYEIHDYKSGKRMMFQKDADKDGQLAIYQIGLQYQYDDVEEVKLVWHYLQHAQEVHSQRNSNQINQLVHQTKLKIDEIREHIQSGDSFSPKETILCNWCYYWEECPKKEMPNPYL